MRPADKRRRIWKTSGLMVIALLLAASTGSVHQVAANAAKAYPSTLTASEFRQSRCYRQ